MLSGTLVGAKVVILPNKFKREDKHPDYNLLITEKEEQGDHKALAQPQEDPAF